ncbi:glycoside hydrolase family 43 protein [Mucilaginibacter sp.]|uniref:glycoside hydrolase family 43 protein n=1 Tax=Mucilaginibacter sp. TaxID=1882438 RepID=UPI003D0D83CD
MTMRFTLIFTCFLMLMVCSISAQNTFTNPLLPVGPDPWVVYHNGYYYYTNSMGNRLELWKTKSMANLGKAQHKAVWLPPVNKPYSKELWAPEMHFLRGKWYMYFAADDGDNQHHRLYVLENSSADPMEGEWVFKGQIADDTNKWAIDASVFENKGQLYMIWSGWEGDVNGEQNIYIAKMANPYTISSKRVRVSSAIYDWEKHGDLSDAPHHVNVNEGPEMLKHGNKLFLVYSASGCWTDHYALGMLTASADADLLDAASWIKSKQPVFKESVENSVYAPGHNGFFKSPNGKEDWIIYHANPKPGCGCDGQRSPRIQKFTWNPDGSPNFGIPVKTGDALAAPGE